LFAGVSCSNSNASSSSHGDNTGSNLVGDAIEIRKSDILDIRFPANLAQGYAEWRSLSAARFVIRIAAARSAGQSIFVAFADGHRDPELCQLIVFFEYRPEVPTKLSTRRSKGIP
jgi:hypothetical protein